MLFIFDVTSRFFYLLNFIIVMLSNNDLQYQENNNE